MDQTVIVYEAGGDIRLEVQTDGETVWLTQAQICQLLGRERSVITKHIGNAIKEGEIDEKRNVQYLQHVRSLPALRMRAESKIHNHSCRYF